MNGAAGMRPRGRATLVGGALALVAVVSCARNPVSGMPELVLVSQEEERAVGREQAREIEETIGLVRDPALTEYVTAIGRRLATQAPPGVDYVFYVPDMPEPNAFALPGGHVYVSRGLLALVNDE